MIAYDFKSIYMYIFVDVSKVGNGFLKSTKSFVRDLSQKYQHVSDFGRNFLQGTSTGVLTATVPKKIRNLYDRSRTQIQRTFSRLTDKFTMLYNDIQVSEVVTRISDGLVMLYNRFDIDEVVSTIKEGYTQILDGAQAQQLLSEIENDLRTLYNSPEVQEILSVFSSLGTLYNDTIRWLNSRDPVSPTIIQSIRSLIPSFH